jgi:epoxyqueuosine reductase
MVAVAFAPTEARILVGVSRWHALREDLRMHALQRGWSALGVTGVEPFDEARRRGLRAVAAGRMDGMPWMTAARVRASTDLGARYPWARSIVALAWPYRPVRPAHQQDPARPAGRMGAYALLEGPGGDGAADYHNVLANGCDELLGWLREREPGTRGKRFVDHGWAMDRAVAERAGIGFTGKHASLITAGAGSYVLLAEILLSAPLPVDEPSKKGCGTCTRCLPSCPTGAIVAPGVIDARRCISYLTIEHRGPVPVELRPLMGTWVFGCDLCQEACPINHRLAPAPREAEAGRRTVGPVAAPDLVELLELDDGQFGRRFDGTAVARTGRARLARNAAIALGNAGTAATLPALRRAATEDADPVVREAAAWAVDRVTTACRAGEVSRSETSVEEPDRHTDAGGDGRAHAGRDERDGIVLRRPPRVWHGPADGDAGAAESRRLRAEDRTGHPGQGDEHDGLGGRDGEMGGADPPQGGDDRERRQPQQCTAERSEQR